MNERKPENRVSQSISIDDRRSMRVTAVDDVISFDLNSVVLGSPLGVISIEGEGLHIRKMNVDGGEVLIEGKINGLNYIDRAVRKHGLLRKK